MNGITGGRPSTIMDATNDSTVATIRAAAPTVTPQMPLTINIRNNGPISPRMLTVCSALNG